MLADGTNICHYAPRPSPHGFVMAVYFQQKRLNKGSHMSTQTPKDESISLEQLVVSHSYEMLALVTILEKKGILTRQEIIEVIKELQGGGKD